MKFVMTQAICPEGMDRLNHHSPEDMEIYVADDPDPNHYLSQMENADALIVRIASCDGNVIDHSPQLKVIGRTGVGFDTVDVKRATERGIPVVITPGANNRSVAEHTLALIFALSKDLINAHLGIQQGNWEIRSAKRSFELQGKTVGILGMGAIGRDVANLCRAVGMNPIGYDPFVSSDIFTQSGTARCETLHDLLQKSDILTIHMPLTSDTKNMISHRELALMKPSALLINCSRGGIVNETALTEALTEGTIAGAATDVFCTEPPTPGDPLLHCPNMILTPHSAAQTREAVIHMANMCVDGCLAILNGQKWPFVANPEVYDHPKWNGKA